MAPKLAFSSMQNLLKKLILTTLQKEVVYLDTFENIFYDL